MRYSPSPNVISPDSAISIEAAIFSIRPVMADSLIYATALAHNATLWTQNADFKGLRHVKYLPRIKNPWVPPSRFHQTPRSQGIFRHSTAVKTIDPDQIQLPPTLLKALREGETLVRTLRKTPEGFTPGVPWEGTTAVRIR